MAKAKNESIYLLIKKSFALLRFKQCYGTDATLLHVTRIGL